MAGKKSKALASAYGRLEQAAIERERWYIARGDHDKELEARADKHRYRAERKRHESQKGPCDAV